MNGPKWREAGSLSFLLCSILLVSVSIQVQTQKYFLPRGFQFVLYFPPLISPDQSVVFPDFSPNLAKMPIFLYLFRSSQNPRLSRPSKNPICKVTWPKTLSLFWRRESTGFLSQGQEELCENNQAARIVIGVAISYAEVNMVGVCSINTALRECAPDPRKILFMKCCHYPTSVADMLSQSCNSSKSNQAFIPKPQWSSGCRVLAWAKPQFQVV